MDFIIHTLVRVTDILPEIVVKEDPVDDRCKCGDVDYGCDECQAERKGDIHKALYLQHWHTSTATATGDNASL